MASLSFETSLELILSVSEVKIIMKTMGRLVCALGVALSCLLVACSDLTTDSTEEISLDHSGQVEAGGERLQGQVLDAESGLTVFRGIPFAAPPVGELRWRPPALHVPRDGLQDAASFGPACPQAQGNVEFYRDVAVRFGESPDMVPAMENISEDCLYLNVWTKLPAVRAKRPVMVWIYGGGNSNGYSHEPEYFGDKFAAKDVVYVSINYRVGAIGFLAHPELSAESERGVSGNYGILDQVAALEWVQRNIEAFGGDPDNVTIFGESAGAANTTTLIASPLGEGLFHRGISQSGGYPINDFYTLTEAERLGSRIALLLTSGEESDSGPTIDSLRQLDWQEIVNGPESAEVGGYSRVNIDGWVLPDALAALYRKGVNPQIELLIGANRNENYPWVSKDAAESELTQLMQEIESPFREEILDLLAEEPAVPLRSQIDRVGSADWFLCPSLYIADQMANNGNNVFFYYFTRVRPNGEDLLAYHGAEISYVHDTAYDWLPADEIDAALTETMGQYWVNFAASGSPNGAGLPEWPAYSPDHGKFQELGDQVISGSRVETELCSILERRRQVRMEQFEADKAPAD